MTGKYYSIDLSVQIDDVCVEGNVAFRLFQLLLGISPDLCLVINVAVALKLSDDIITMGGVVMIILILTRQVSQLLLLIPILHGWWLINIKCK